MHILSIKGLLLCYLGRILFSADEEIAASFTNFLHNGGTNPYSFSRNDLRKSANWRSIPLQKKSKVGHVLYISALPQVVASHGDLGKCLSLSSISNQLVKRLNQVQFQAANCDLDHQNFDSILISELWPEFKIETNRPGWISLQLSNQGTERWIQRIQKGFQIDKKNSQLFVNRDSPNQTKSSLFNAFNRLDRDHINTGGIAQKNPAQRSDFSEVLESNLPMVSADNNSPFTNRFFSDQALAKSADQKPLLANPQQTKGSTHKSNSGTPSQGTLPQGTVSINTDAVRTPPAALLPVGHTARALLWQGQYTHARCCTLLRLLKAAPQQASSHHNGDKNLPLGDPSHQRLRQALIETADDLFWIPYRWPSKQYFLLLKSSEHLCRAFESFYRTYLSGFSDGFSQEATLGDDSLEAIAPGPQSAQLQAQYGEVLATRNLLKILLQEYLGEIAPAEL